MLKIDNCMKRELFSVADEEFVTLLNRTHEGFEREGMKYMFVGGVATQLHVAKLLCDSYSKTLIDLVKSSDIRIQDHLRATDDVDIAIRVDGVGSDIKGKEMTVAKKVFSVLNYIVQDEEYFSPSEENIIRIHLDKRGHVRPVFQLGINGIVDSDKKVSFNIYNDPKDLKNGSLKEFEDRYYDQFLNNASDLSIPFSNKGNLFFKVKNKEDLLATKIARGRPKDINDALSLVKHIKAIGGDIDYSAVESILCSPDQRYHVQNEELCNRYGAFMGIVRVFN